MVILLYGNIFERGKSSIDQPDLPLPGINVVGFVHLSAGLY